MLSRGLHLLCLLALALPVTSCLDHRVAPNCEFEIPPASQDPGERCNDDIQCIGDAVCFEGTCVGDGNLRVSLAWSAFSDFDLHVVLPNGHEIFYLDPVHSTGRLDIDDCILNCRDNSGTHVENVFFGADAQVGTYRVFIVNFDGRSGGDFALEVDGDGVFDRWEETLPGFGGAVSEVFTFEYNP